MRIENKRNKIQKKKKSYASAPCRRQVVAIICYSIYAACRRQAVAIICYSLLIRFSGLMANKKTTKLNELLKTNADEDEDVDGSDSASYLFF